MEESVRFEFRDCFEEMLHFKEVDVRAYSPLVLAYIGDTVYDLIIKSMIVNEGNKQVQKMHEETSHYVQACAQSLMMRSIQPHLTEEEHAVYRRGRNAKSVSPAKNQTITDYRRATGFEALIGYLYLEKKYERLTKLVSLGLECLRQNGNVDEGTK